MDPRLWRLRTRNNQNTFIIPSAYYLASPDMFKYRQNIAPKIFVDRVLRGVHGDEVKDRLIVNIRPAVLEETNIALKDHSVHFNRLEISTLLNTYYALTNYEVRPIKPAELKSFLYLTLNITNASSLQGLYRAGTKLMKRTSLKSVVYFDGLAFIRLMSVLLRGSIEERAALTFYILDEDDDGMITPKTEITHSLRSSFDPYVSASAPEIDPEEPSRDTMRYLIKKMGMSIDGGINMDDFINECLLSPWLIDGIVPTLPSEISNYAFQSLVTQVPKLPLIENRAARNRSIVSIRKKKRKEK